MKDLLGGAYQAKKNGVMNSFMRENGLTPHDLTVMQTELKGKMGDGAFEGFMQGLESGTKTDSGASVADFQKMEEQQRKIFSGSDTNVANGKYIKHALTKEGFNIDLP